MTSPLLAKARHEGREIVNVTPERAGWTHVGFRALRLAEGDSEALDTGARELCIVVLAGKVGSAIASQLGTMRVTEQVDALEVMGINSATYLIFPKIVAALITFPLLIILAAFLQMAGGLVAGAAGKSSANSQ